MSVKNCFKETRAQELAAGHQMINEIQIQNYRCYEKLAIKNVKRINVIVGDNGAGKTTLLEAIFLAIGSSTELAVRTVSYRGLVGQLQGLRGSIEKALWGQLFYDYDWSRQVTIKLIGTGPEARQVWIARGDPTFFVPVSSGDKPLENRTDSATADAPVRFTWVDSKGEQRTAVPQLTDKGLTLPGTNEDLPTFHFFAANQIGSSTDLAENFSALSRAGGKQNFIELFKADFPWIEDFSIEVYAGAPVVHAKVKGRTNMFPVNSLGGGITRMLTVASSVYQHKNGVVLIDEFENGIYHERLGAYWRALITLARGRAVQIFATTHSAECLKGLIDAAGDDAADIAFWRVEHDRGSKEPKVKQFTVAEMHAGLDYGEEVR